jgi:hypothetical protein
VLYRSHVKNFQTTLANVRHFTYGALVLMINATQTFLAEAACAASTAFAHAPVAGERRTDDAPALAGRYTT